ncbi:MAG: Pyrrolo-quinoline quinone [Solirubrobacterales bacterium]|nr:Pyrrolo-quinoline quinone [Solirubrobacterales bacterium]
MSTTRNRLKVRWALGIIAVAVFSCTTAGSAPAEVTGAADNLRTAWYSGEPYLTPSFVTKPRFGKVFEDSLQGQIYAQPLMANGTLLVVTEENWAYGIDPVTGARRWEDHLGTAVEAGLGKTINCADLEPRVGVTGTPVIDTERNVAYFVAHRYVSGGSGEIAWYMHGIKLDNGEEAPNFPVRIQGQAQNLAGVNFEAGQELQRPALLMMNGVVYAGFGSHCDNFPYEGWIAGVSSAGALTTMWAVSAKGASIWQSGGGLISDRPGQILFTSGNGNSTPGSGDPLPGPGSLPPEGRLGESVVRVAAQPGGGLRALDFFSPFNNKSLDESDIDLGASAPVALPSQYFATPGVANALIQDGKYGTVYLLNRDNLGGMAQGPGGTDGVVQELGPYGGVWGAAAVWPGDGRYVYVPTVSEPASSNETKNSLRFFRYEQDAAGNPRLAPAAATPEEFWFGSGSPVVTSNGIAGGSAVVWITDCLAKACAGEQAELRAYSGVPSSAKPEPFWSEKVGLATKFSRPLASAGHVYVGNHEGRLMAFSGPFTPSTALLDLGATPVGGQLSGVVTFTVTGKQVVEVLGVRGSSSPFTVTGLPAPGTKLTPGQVVTVEVTFRPSAPGHFTDSLAINTQFGEFSVGVSASGIAPPAVTAGVTRPVIPREAVPVLTKLKIRASASRLRAHRNKRVAVSYSLSARATVVVSVFRRVRSHHCRRHVKRCYRWASTRIRLKVAGHSGKNLLTVKLGTRVAGDYRLTATPVNRAGVAGITRHLDFKLFH